MKQATPKPTPLNPGQDLIQALSLFEQVKGLRGVAAQPQLLKEIYGTQLVFAKELVDVLSATPGGLNAKEIEHAKRNELIPAVQLIRKRLPECTLPEAKGMVQKWQKENRVDPCGG